MSWLALVVFPVLATLIAMHLDRRGASIAKRVVRFAALLVPSAERAAQRDEWIDHVRSAGSRGIGPVLAALSIAFLAAPLVAVLARFDARRTPPRIERPGDELAWVVTREEYVELPSGKMLHIQWIDDPADGQAPLS